MAVFFNLTGEDVVGGGGNVFGPLGAKEWQAVREAVDADGGMRGGPG